MKTRLLRKEERGKRSEERGVWSEIRFKLLLLLALLNVQYAMFNELKAQEAFYIYRNDGNFDGFFFDEVQSMSVSKFDLDSIEHDDYVVQDIVLADTTYRIPLAAIDSVGFQQPEIVLNERFYDVFAEDCPYNASWHFEFLEDNPYTIRWGLQKYADGYHLSELPHVGDVLYSSSWIGSKYNEETETWENVTLGPFIGKVREIKVDTNVPDYFYDREGFYLVECDPIEDFGEVFDRLVSVERLGTDQNGKRYSRMAGLDKVKRRISGNKEVTLIDLNGTFPISLYGTDTFTATLDLNLALAIKAGVAYNISTKNFLIKMTFKEEAEVSAGFTAKGTLDDTTTWWLADVPIFVPSFLPVIQINPAPGAFVKTSGDMSLKIGTPKLGYKGSQTVVINKTKISGSVSNDIILPKDEDNKWTMELSLNGSVQAGTHFPFNIETNSWAKKIFWCSTGVDVFVGPKLSASFALDAESLAKGDAYNTLANSKVSFAQVAAAFEATAKFSTGTQYEEEFKVFEGEAASGREDLTVFPSFETSVLEKIDESVWGTAHVNVFPRGKSLPFYVGIAAYDEQKRLYSRNYANYNPEAPGTFLYGLNNTTDQLNCQVDLADGNYSVVPVIRVLGYDVPAWGNEITVRRDYPLSLEGSDLEWRDEYHPYGPNKYHAFGEQGTFVLHGLRKDDIVEFELVKGEEWIYDSDNADENGWIEGTTQSIGQRVTFTDLTPIPESPEEDILLEESVAYLQQGLGQVTLYPVQFHKRSYRYNSDLKRRWSGKKNYNPYNTIRAKVMRDSRIVYSKEIEFHPYDPPSN